jgi:hypothetical protein
MVALVRQLMVSRYGELLVACRDAEERVRFLGYDPANVKTVAYMIAAFMAGIAGALFVPIVGIVSPNDVGIVPSIGFLIGVAIGGRTTLLGPVLGAIAVAWAGTTLSETIPSGWTYIQGFLLGRTGAPCQDRSWWVSPARPPHPACDSHRTGRSTCLASGSAVGGGCRVRCPRGRDPAAAVAVAGDRDAGCAGEGDPVVGDPPSDVAEATSEFFHPEPVLARVLGPYPPHQPTPRVVVDRTEHVLGHPVPEVGRPPDQGLVETDDQLVQILVPG